MTDKILEEITDGMLELIKLHTAKDWNKFREKLLELDSLTDSLLESQIKSKK